MARPAQGGRARRHPDRRAGDVELGLLVPWHGSGIRRGVGTRLNVAQVKNADEIERSIEAAARELSSGLIVLPGPETAIHRDKIIALTAKHRLPTVYPYRYYVASGGVMSYGIDTVHLTRQAASYVDRILNGAKPAELPVQAADQVRAGDQSQDRQGARPMPSRRRCSPAPTR